MIGYCERLAPNDWRWLSKIRCSTWRSVDMPESLTNQGLWEKGLALLETQLGPVETLRFMAMISRQPFDYQRWREEHFGGVSVDEVLDQAQSGED
jgi:hypothetical protein